MSLWSYAAIDGSSWVNICEKNLSVTDLGPRGENICPLVCIWVRTVTFRHTERDRKGWRGGRAAGKNRKSVFSPAKVLPKAPM